MLHDRHRPVFRIEKDQIAVRYADVDRLLQELKKFESLLSTEEVERAGRFRSARDRQRYIVTHGMLRSLLAGYMDCEPRQVDIGSGIHGKPTLAGAEGEAHLHFSLSQSGAYAAFAFCLNRSIGVDIEEIKAIPEMEGVIDQHFTKKEAEFLRIGPEIQRLVRFYRIWTRKEAVLKAQGEGLLKALDSVDVAGKEDNGPRTVEVTGEAGVEEYSVVDVDCQPGYATAVAVRGPIAGC